MKPTTKEAEAKREEKALQRKLKDCGVACGFTPIIAGLLAKKLRAEWAEMAKRKQPGH